MVLSSNTTFDTKHALANKTPMYNVHFDLVDTDFCNHKPKSSDLKLDFTTFAETDTPGKVTVAANTITLTDGDRDEDYWVTKDFGAGFFTDFVHWVDVNVTAQTDDVTSRMNPWALSNGEGGLFDIQDLVDDNRDLIFVDMGRSTAILYRVRLLYATGGSTSLLGSSTTISVGTEVFLSISRVGTVVKVEIYSTAALRIVGGSGDVDTISGTAISTAFRYVYGLVSRNNAGTTKDISGTSKNLIIHSFKQYLSKISGLSQTVMPEEGRLSVGGVASEIVDVDDEITALIATDSHYFHRKKTTIKAGYGGMDEADMLTIMTGWVTALKLTKSGLSYAFTSTDPQKWMQRKIFRGAEDSTVTISGNPLTILLALLTSTGAGTNGTYDYYAAVNGLGIDEDYIDVAGIEAVRDDWYPGTSHYMSFSIVKRIKAKDFFEKEIFKILNLYPTVDGQGRFSVKPFKPPLAATSAPQTITRDDVIDMPGWDSNLAALVNEVECHYDWNATTEIYDTIDFYVDSTSLNNRGPGKKPIILKSKGLTTANGGFDVMARRKTAIFARFATPPIMISYSAFFSKWLLEAGDIPSFTHSKVPDISAGTRGITGKRMEVISRAIEWRRGRVKMNLLDTGFDKGTYGVISPTMTVLSAADGENFVVSAADAAKYDNLTSPEVQLATSKMRTKVAAKTILTINTTTGAITCDDWGVTPVAGDFVLFADYDSCTDEQKNWGFIADSSDNLGAADDDAHLIAP